MGVPLLNFSDVTKTRVTAFSGEDITYAKREAFAIELRSKKRREALAAKRLLLGSDLRSMSGLH